MLGNRLALLAALALYRATFGFARVPSGAKFNMFDEAKTWLRRARDNDGQCRLLAQAEAAVHAQGSHRRAQLPLKGVRRHDAALSSRR